MLPAAVDSKRHRILGRRSVGESFTAENYACVYYVLWDLTAGTHESSQMRGFSNYNKDCTAGTLGPSDSPLHNLSGVFRVSGDYRTLEGARVSLDLL